MKESNSLYPEPSPPSYVGSFFAYLSFFEFLLLSLLVVAANLAKSTGDSEWMKHVFKVVGFVGTLCFFGLAALAHKATRLRIAHCYGFREGLLRALADWRLMLACIPIVGSFIAPKPKE